ncbi:AraC family transcriptional regulator [Paenibacillus sp. J23TS9]|uniref:helix-turn-helix domain-containing protein n=1 Tax=Paenibacillus sp. J23TS9 TaxID=2807193 RepID=UPI001B2D0A13|nr:helix-turn-helix domain-containing protein [Paenibacillus sp. J23TS9]GIP25836.1 AraC family transcriptional regulator [Paenibacillus sp. J23TS9]
MYDKLPVLSPEETIPLLQDQFYYPPYITLAHMYKPPTGWFMIPQVISQYQLLYGVDGSAESIVDGVKHPIGKGDIYIIRPDAVRSLQPSKHDPYVGITISFHFGVSKSPLQSLFENDYYRGQDPDGSLLGKLISLIQAIQQKKLTSNMLAQGLLLQILYELSNNIPVDETARQATKINAKMVKICNYIKENYSTAIRLDTLSKMTGLSRNYIIRQFRKCYGMTPSDYLATIRIEKAKQLALETDLSISEIANQVGYSELHSFSRMFKKRMGISLSQFNATLISSIDIVSPLEES